MKPRVLTLVVAAGATATAAITAIVAPMVIRFFEPSRLWLLLVSAALFTLFASYRAWRVAIATKLGHLETVQAMVANDSPRRAWAQATLVCLGVAFVVLAMARPQWGERIREVERRGIDVVFAVDLSRSMLAEDVAPSRLAAATSEIGRLMRRLDGDRVGLVVFAGDAVVQSPLTSDHGAIEHYLNRVSPADFSRQGTAIGRAITSSVELLTGRFADGFDRAGTQIVIVFSDGEDNVSDPIAAARAAAEAGITVYTVGVGSTEGARIPVRGPDGGVQGYVTDRNGQIVLSKLEEEQLREVATTANGRYLRLAPDASVSQALAFAIEQYDAENLSSVLRAEYEDRFHVFAVPAFILLLIAMLIGDRTRRPQQRSIAAALLVAAALIGGCTELPERDEPRVERAIEQFEADNIVGARDLLDEASPEARVQPRWEYNRGRVDEADTQLEAAQERYLRAVAAEEVDAQVRALFALGNVLLARERYEEATERYRRVLSLAPDHAGAQRNLEIALRRLFPPCTALDDESEENDEAASASQLPATAFESDFVPPGAAEGSGESADYVICGNDPDWHVMTALGGSTVDVEVTFRRLRADNGGARLPDTIPPTAVRIALLGHDGMTPLAVDQGLAELESVAEGVSASRITRRIEQVVIDPGLGNDSLAYLKVDVDYPLEYDYTVTINVVPPCWALEDEFESNDMPATARAMPEGEHVARICNGNEDWYAFDVAPDHDVFVDLSPMQRNEETSGSIDVAFFIDQTEVPLTEQTVTAETGLAAFSVRSPGVAPRRAYLRIRSTTEEDEGNYQLTVYDFAPCPDDDRFEPNDDPDTRTQLGADPPPPYRHLRICPQNADWFEMAIPPPEEDAEGSGEGSGEPAPIPFSALVLTDPGMTAIVTLFDPQTGEQIAQSNPVFAPSGEGDPSSGDHPVAPPVAPSQAPPVAPPAQAGAPPAPPLPIGFAAATALKPGTQSVIVSVVGTPGFYHLEFPETQQQQQQQQQQQEQEPEESEEQEESDEEQQNEPEEGEEGEEETEEEGETGEPTPDEQQEAAAEPTEEETAEERREELLRLLESLEDRDVNLQIQQALQDLPPEQFEESW